jgi:acetyl esterase/lipase
MRVDVARLWVALVTLGPLACSPAHDPSANVRLPASPVPAQIDHWFLDAAGRRLTLALSLDDAGGTATDEFDGTTHPIDRLSSQANPVSSSFSFRIAGSAQDDWYRVSIVDGVLRGRVANVPSGSEPTALDYQAHVTGWSADVFDGPLWPRVFELLTDDNWRVRLRIDRAPGGVPEGRLKRYAALFGGANYEQTEADVRVDIWDGTNLAFTRLTADGEQQWVGVVDGRSIAGTVRLGTSAHTFTGARAEVLSHGLVPRSSATRERWQAQTRRRLVHLLMADGPAPLSQIVTLVASGLAPTPALSLPAERDDAIGSWPSAYTSSEVRLDHLMPDPNGGAPLARAVHVRTTVPTAPMPAGGWPALLAVNGHSGSARLLLDPDDQYYWYADSFARRGYVVVAVDISHRPVEDRGGLYAAYVAGDDPAGGNGPHPAIRADGFDSDFEEDGERAWDVLRAHEYLRTLAFVDPRRVTIAGLSLGGEIATLVGALDPELSATVAGGYSADLGVQLYHGNHECWEWLNGDLREYVETSDLHALIAPRPLVVETGLRDHTFSALATPSASDREVVRRSRAAYADAPTQLVHYLHDDVHHFHVGDRRLDGTPGTGLCTPVLDGPRTPDDDRWQTDPEVACSGITLFDWLVRPILP